MVDIYTGLKSLGGVAKTNRLRAIGVSRNSVSRAVRRGSVLKLRKGWYGLASLHPYELRATSLHGFLTCSSAALVRNLPVDDSQHFHLQSNRGVKDARSGRRRIHFTNYGAMVSVVDMTEDYLHCQQPEWSLALVDELTRKDLLSEVEWSELESRLPSKLRKLVKMRSSLPESPLESVVRHKLLKDKFLFDMQRPFGRYRVDFLVHPGVVLETHGAEFHATKDAWEKDRERNLWLRTQGLDVIEVTFKQVRNWNQVREAIKHAQTRQFRDIRIS